jgi:tagatose-6-phosphate ketose/aldose isomerase
MPDFRVPPVELPDGWLAPLWLLMPQQLALHKSAALGLTPDNPFPDGTLNRVVAGVTIHSHVAC